MSVALLILFAVYSILREKIISILDIIKPPSLEAFKEVYCASSYRLYYSMSDGLPR